MRMVPPNEGHSSGTRKVDRRITLMRSLRELRYIADSAGLGVIRETLEGVERRLSEGRFHVVVLGGFKRGKSTLINAMLGSNVLPTGVPPLTSVITKISYGSAPKAEVFFENDTRKAIDIKLLESFVTEKGNPGNEKGVSEVEVLLRNGLLRDRVVIIDTPGVGSTYTRNSRVTYEFLENADAAVFVFGADPPIGQMEIELLEEIRGNTRKVFFVQNKIDKLEGEERLEALKFSEFVLHEALQSDVTIYPMSARLAIEAKLGKNRKKLEDSGYPRLERDLESFLFAGRAEAELSAAAQRGQKVAWSILAATQIERSIISRPYETADRQVALMQKELDTARRVLEDMDALIDSRVFRMLEQFTDRLDGYKSEAKIDLIKELDVYLQSLPKSIGRGKLAGLVGEHISNAIQEHFDPIARSTGKEISEWLRSATLDTFVLVERVSRELEGRAADAFGVRRFAPSLPEVPGEESRFYFEDVSIFKWESIIPAGWPMILPARLLRKVIADKARKTILEEIEKHSGRLRSDVDYRLSESSRRLKVEARKRLEGSIQSIEHALTEGLKSREAAAHRKNARLNELGEIEARLASITSELAVLTA